MQGGTGTLYSSTISLLYYVIQHLLFLDQSGVESCSNFYIPLLFDSDPKNFHTIWSLPVI